MSGNPVEHQLPSQKLSLSGGNTTSMRGLGASSSSSSGRVGTPNPMAVASAQQSHQSMMQNGVSLRNVHIVSPAGLSSDQAQRAQSLLAAGAPSTVGPRLRAIELLHFWASSESAVRAIEDQISDVLRVAGINSNKSPMSSSSDSGSASAYSPKVPSVHKLGARSPHTASLQPTTGQAAASSADAAEVNAMEQPPELELAVEGPREDTASTALSIGGGTDNAPSRSSSSSSLALTLGSTTTADNDASPRRRTLGRGNLTAPHPKSPRSASPSSAFHGGGGNSNSNLSAHYHIVDEVDAAHARGALSPRSVSPAMQLNQDIGGVPQSPLDALQPNDMTSSMLRRSPASMDTPSSLTTTPRRPGEEHRDGRPSRSPSPAGSIRMSDDLSQARVHSSHSQRKMSNLSGTSDKPEKMRYASYQDIPRFYFAEGKPQTQSTTLIGPHSNKHENPHLTLFEGVAVPVGGQAQLLLAQQQLGGGGSLDLSSLQPQGPKLSPMLPLAVMEDEDVIPFIQREFARLPAPPAKQQPVQQQPRATKGSSVLRRPTTSSNAPTKQEQAYRQALTATMHRVCTQAFGLPKYIGQLVFRKLSADAEAADETAMPPTASMRPGTSSGASVGSGSGSVGSGNITVQQVKEFYEKYLRFKSIVRRMFEVLIATSKVQVAMPPAALGGAMSGMAPSALPGAAAAADQRRNYLVRDDFAAYLDVLLESHPGLGFLRQTQDFQGKYLETVVIRIFYDLDRYDRGRITWPEFEHSKLPDAIRQVDATDDINTVLNYFSYEHFYVLYCRFWELDEDRDMLISQQDLQRYAPDGTMNPQIVERVFQGHGRKLSCKTRGKMNYEDFVWFCLSEEDKSSPKAIRYWFRVLDLDGDGILCGHELESFYAHTKKQLLQMTTEGISFSDVVCQVADMLPFQLKQGIRLGDMLAAPQSAHVALNMIMNVIRFLHFEQRDPFVAHHDRLLGGFERNDWDRFARQEYDRMAQEADGE